MYRIRINEATRRLAYSLVVVGLAIAALVFAARFNTTDASPAAGTAAKRLMLSPQAAFPANAGTLGPIPDGPGTPTTCGSDGAPLNVTFTVSGMTAPLSSVQLSETFSPAHTWRGDLGATLIAPNATSMLLYKYINSTTAGGCGSSNDFAGPYVFSDTGASATNIWSDTNTITPAGTWRNVGTGGAGAANPPAFTNLTAAFSGLTTAQINGTWTLRMTDGGAGDTGSVSAATLTLVGAAAPAQHIIDFDGDGKTDFSIVRNTGGGPSGQVTWMNQINGSGAVSGAQWGIASDFFVPADYDGDGKTDIAVWRPGTAQASGMGFYILQSATNTLKYDNFGQTGDDPTVVADYDGDGKADVAVYRGGATAGAQSTWFYRGTLSNPLGNVTFIPWGQNGDFPSPGDYDGDGKADFVVQRNNGGGQARFWIRFANGTIDNSIVFGTPTDVVVPGDYDGDGKTDIAVVRASGGFINWFVRKSSTGTISANPDAIFGLSASDFVAQGDYDGDGKTDFAVWRPNADPTQNFFFYLRSNGGTAAQSEWGQNGDYPVANYNTH